MTREHHFSSVTSELAGMRNAVGEFLDECGFEECAAALLVLALDEACTNVIRYAYEHQEGPMRLKMERLSDRIRFTLRDYGKTCNPECIRSRDLADIRPGGVGVHIIQQAFDVVRYEPRPRGTKLTLEKKLDTCTEASSAE
ncbi:hypothetical protein BH09VER1_BH09VER1_08430 [soil metagenome]